MDATIGIRWTIGDVNPRGFAALQLSIWGAYRIFAESAAYAVCVNTVPLEFAKELTGPLPWAVDWVRSGNFVSPVIQEHMDGSIADGVGWKFAPMRLFPYTWEIALDNDCILWSIPPSIESWLASTEQRDCLLAEDVRGCYGQFESLCPPEPRNSGIRGLPPGFDIEAAMARILRKREQRTGFPVIIANEQDEQGLQTAALHSAGKLHLVSVREVSICSPFHPHIREPGEFGVHFVGLNARHIPFAYYGRPADEWMTEHWRRLYPIVRQQVGLAETVLSPATRRDATCVPY